MKARLVRKHHARYADERHLVDELGVESERGGERGFVLEDLAVIARLRADRRVHVAANPRVVTVDALVLDDRVDLSQRREPCVPYRLRMIASEAVDEIGEPVVGNHREVRARVTGVDCCTSLALDHRDALAGRGQQICGGEAGDSAADDRDVHLLVAIELSKPGQRYGIEPIRQSVGA